MGRLITYDSVVQEKLNLIAKHKTVQSGLIIGQLVRALPGGLNILGFYIAAPSDYSTKQQAQLRQSSATPADWKFQTGNLKWQQVRCQLAVDLKFPIKEENGSLNLQKQIEIGLHPFLKTIQEAHTLVNGLQRDLDELLDTSVESKRSKKKQASDKEERVPSPEWHNVELFISLDNNNNVNPEISDCVCMMTVKGAVQCRAYVHGKATVGDAVNVLNP
ncbi:unnamed protein product [Larinioides sclopetarius]|uniref:Uncharacterized protein n=1 Tax=Larinioides sclopetarius TaxID=280406 RepID=A0AAV2C0H0_9ARAC